MTYQSIRGPIFPVSLPTLGGGRSELDHSSCFCNHPLEFVAVILAVAIHIDRADQRKPGRCVRCPSWRKDDVAAPDRSDDLICLQDTSRR